MFQSDPAHAYAHALEFVLIYYYIYGVFLGDFNNVIYYAVAEKEKQE